MRLLILFAGLLAYTTAEPVGTCKFWNNYIRDSESRCIFWQCAPDHRNPPDYAWVFAPVRHDCAPGTSVLPDYVDGRVNEHDMPEDEYGVKIDFNPCIGPAVFDCAGTQPVASWGEWGIMLDPLSETSFVRGRCTKDCGGGVQMRYQDCYPDDHPYCQSINRVEERPCNTQPCQELGEWTGYGRCSVSCGDGYQTRIRECYGPGCESIELQQSRPCNNGACVIAQWSQWSAFSECPYRCTSPTVGPGLWTRFRTCNNGVEGVDCPGSSTQTEPCNTQACACMEPTAYRSLDIPDESDGGDGDYELDDKKFCEARYVTDALYCRTVRDKISYDQLLTRAERSRADPFAAAPCVAKRNVAQGQLIVGFVCINELWAKAKGQSYAICPDFEVAAKCCEVP